MKKCFVIFATISLFLFCRCRESNINRPDPTRIVRQELVSSNKEFSIYRNCVYELVEIKYDTIPAKNLSTIEFPSSYQPKQSSDRVNLNDIFDPSGKGDIDWNYVELTAEDVQYLKSIGIYWDSEFGWRSNRK